MSYNGAGSAVPNAVLGNGSNRLKAIVLAVISAFFVLGLTSAANAAEPVANPVVAQTNDVTPVVVHFSATDSDGQTLTYAIGDSPEGGSLSGLSQAAGGSVTYTANADFAGVDNFTYTVSDGFDTVEAGATVVVKPETMIDGGPSGLTNDNTPSWTFSSPQTGVTFECKVDSGTFSVCASPFTASTLSDGPHSFQVRSAKSSVKDGTPAGTTINVDATAPELALNRANGQDDHTNDPAIKFALTSNENLDADTVTTDDFVATNGTVDSITGSGQTFNINVTPTADGTVTIDTSGTFSVTDTAGNEVVTGVAGNLRSVIYDTQVTIAFDSVPVDGNLDARPSITFSSSEDPDVTYECRLYETATAVENIPAYAACESGDQLSFLDKNVSYTYDVKGTDLGGNTDEISVAWLQSNTAPVVVEPTETVEAGEAVTLNLGGSDADSDVLTYAITGEVTGGTLGTIDQGTGDVEFTAAGDSSGEYTFGYTVSDSRQGGTTGGIATVNVQPNTVIDTEPNAETNDVTPTWTYSSPAGGTTFECSLDSGAWENCDGGSYTPAADLTEGSHDFAVRATEGALADPTPATSSTIVDITAPDVTITSNPVALSNVAAPVFEFESTDATATFECSIDGGAYAACVSGDALPAFTDGDHTFSVQAVDPGGNIGPADDYAWEVDLTLPVIALGGQPEDVKNGPGEGKETNARRPIWYFTTEDTNLDSATTSCKVDARPAITPCTSPWQADANLNDGTHLLTIETTDAAGNLQTFTASFRVSTITPSVVINDGPQSPSGPAASFTFASTTDLGPDGKFQCRTSVNGGSYSTWADCATPYALSGLSTAVRTLQVRAVDTAGNNSVGAAVASYTWSTVGGVPDTVISGSTNSGKSAAIGFNSPGNPLATFECRIDAGAWAACTSIKSYTNLSVGSHTFEVRATNEVGTTDASPATKTWAATNPTSPNTNITVQPSATTTDTEATFEFASTKSVASFECKLDGGAFEACESPKTYTGLSKAAHTFEVRSTSDDLVDLSPATAAWTVQELVEDPGPTVVCNPRPASPFVTDSAKLSKKLQIAATVSHSDARPGQVVSVKLNANAKKKKALKKSLKSVVVTSGGTTVATLKGSSWKGSFTVADGQADDLKLKFVRKKGKAITKSASLDVLPACVNS